MAKAFSFKLEALKKHRERKLLLAKKDFAVLTAELTDLEAGLDEFAKQRKESLADAFEAGEMSTGLLLSLDAYRVEAAQSKLQDLRERKSFVGREHEKHREWVAHLSKELRAVEKLEEKQRERFETEQKIREKRKEDSWVAENWTRRSQGEES